MNDVEVSAAGHTFSLMAIDDVVYDKEQVLELIRQRLLELLDHDFNRLLSLLYRIDIRESQSKSCFGKPNKEIAACLAVLIWQRQLEKAESRKKYKS